MDNDDTERSSVVSDVVIDMLYAVVIGVNVYVIIDQVTDGALSRSVSLRIAHARQKASHWIHTRRQYRRDLGQVLWQATTTLEDDNNGE